MLEIIFMMVLMVFAILLWHVWGISSRLKKMEIFMKEFDQDFDRLRGEIKCALSSSSSSSQSWCGSFSSHRHEDEPTERPKPKAKALPRALREETLNLKRVYQCRHGGALHGRKECQHIVEKDTIVLSYCRDCVKNGSLFY